MVPLWALLCMCFLLFALQSTAQVKAGFTVSVQAGCSPLVVNFQDASTGNPTQWKWDLGNGVTSTNQNPVASYFDPGSYTVKLVVSNASGKDSIIQTNYITVYANPVANFSLDDSMGCSPLNADFTDKSVSNANSITKWVWDFGDGTISNESNPSHAYTTAGTFGITLQVVNSFGCSNTINRKDVVQVLPNASAAFAVASEDICHSPAKVAFQNNTQGSNINYQWDFGDGTTSTDVNPVKTYNQKGVYTVVLKAISSNGCIDTTSIKLDVSFAQSSIGIGDVVCSNVATQFTNTSTPQPVSSKWDFGDGTTSTLLNPVKTYTQTGSFTILLINQYSSTCIDSITKQITVNSGPRASFSAVDSIACAVPFTVHFNNTTNGAAQNYQWDFGDGATSTDINAVHTYSKMGSYRIVLKAFNANGCADSMVDNVKFQPLKIKSINPLPSSGCTPITVSFSDTLNDASNGIKYQWDFGDGTTSTTASPSHTYTKEGAYNVKLQVSTADGCMDTLTLVNAVKAGHKPTADFSLNKNQICQSDLLYVYNHSTNGPVDSIVWNFGDGQELYNINTAIHQYSKPGVYNVSLVVGNSGCFDTLVKQQAIKVLGPNAAFNVKQDCSNKTTVSFINESIGDSLRHWDFGDGTTSTDRNPIHTYAKQGIYYATLNTSNNQCSATSSVRIIIVDKPGNINVSDSVSCRKQDIVFTLGNIDSSLVLTTIWLPGDGRAIVSKGFSDTISYNSAGTFNPKAVIVDVNGCRDTAGANAAVHVFGPTANFKSATGACRDSALYLQDSSLIDGTHKIVKWTINYGDNTPLATYNAPPFFHNYDTTGTFNIKYLVQDSYGCIDSINKTNAVRITKPVAAFSISDSSVCPGKQITFKNTSTGVALKAIWSFGDGGTSTTYSPLYLYTIQGVYNPKLVISDMNNCKDSITSPVAIRVYTPSASFLASDSFSTCPPLSVLFTNQSKNYQSLQWSFDDGNISTLFSPTHLFTYPGQYNVKLVLKGNGACADSASKRIIILGPTGELQYDKTPACYPVTTQFTANAKDAVQYVWDYGDGNSTSSTIPSSTHVYDTGSFIPRLVLVDKSNCRVGIKGVDTIHIYDVKALASLQNNLLCDSGFLFFKDSSITHDVITQTKWLFGDGGSSTKSSGNYTYNRTGIYNVTLMVATKAGCKDTVTINNAVKVVGSPVIAATGDSNICVNNYASFKADLVRQDTSALVWQWNFGNNQTSNIQNPPSVQYNNAGAYNIIVTATNSSGCVGKDSLPLIVNPLPAINAGVDATICRFNSYTLTATGGNKYYWSSSQKLSCDSCTSPLIVPDSSAWYYLAGTDKNGCSNNDSVYVKVIQPVNLIVGPGDTTCVGSNKTLQASGADIYQWSPGIYLNNTSIANPVFHATTDTTIQYTVIASDQNHCFTDTASVTVKAYPIPSVKINGPSDITINVGNSVALTTQNSADVTSWRWNPPQGLNDATIPNPIAAPKETTVYTVVAANAGSCVSRAQITINVICNNANIYIPNTFSPNNDGVNDVFYVRGTGLYTIKSMIIFNRWGQVVFEKMNFHANDANAGWNGKYNGVDASSDAYVYICEILCENNTVIPLKGSITLIR
jgi:gliding motility-associated-like protein